MTEYSRMAKGSYIATTGTAQTIFLPFQPDFVEIYNTATAADNGVPYAFWDSSMAQGTAFATYFTTAPAVGSNTVTAGGISTFTAGLALQFGAAKQVVSTTLATGNFEVTAHGYATGDIVIFQGLYSTQFTAGSPQIDGMPFVITVVDANNFTINWDMNQSNFTALAASPAGATVRKVLYPFLYLPGVNFISDIEFDTPDAGQIQITTTTPHNYVVGQEIAFRIPEEYGTFGLNSLPNTTTPGSPVYYYVASLISNTQFTIVRSSADLTAFDSNQPVSIVSGLDFPQVVAVGDVNTGGTPISVGSDLYPPPAFPTFSGGVNTINGPAIRGAFVNNTRQGFTIGTGAVTGAAATSLVGLTGNVVIWRAFLHDIS